MIKSLNSSLLKITQKSTKSILFIFLFLCFLSCDKNRTPTSIHISEQLKVTKVNEHSYIHTSFLTLKNGTLFPCNGFIYYNKSEAYIFDSPANEISTNQLINWIQDSLKLTIKGVIFNHFHTDCIGGLNTLKKHNIPTIANSKTKEIMTLNTTYLPDITFEGKLELKLGDKTIINTFFGEAHTVDNIVSYFPDEKTLFGGCMIKSLEAKKGNLTDANINEWSNTVQKIKDTYTDIKYVIPGHGDYGDSSLLTYTISLFDTKKIQ